MCVSPSTVVAYRIQFLNILYSFKRYMQSNARLEEYMQSNTHLDRYRRHSNTHLEEYMHSSKFYAAGPFEVRIIENVKVKIT